MAVKASARGSGRRITTAVTVPAVVDVSFLGAPPLIPGEKAAVYKRLLAAVTDEIKPTDPMETMWTRDFVDLQWEIIRFRRIKADLITHRYERVRHLLTENLNGELANIVAININVIERASIAWS